MLFYRLANKDDMLLYYKWVNDNEVREQSFHSNKILLSEHKEWFYRSLKNENLLMFVFFNEYKAPIGQIRIQKENNKIAVISISIDKLFRGKGYGSEMLDIVSTFFLKENKGYSIYAYIKPINNASKKSFLKAGFKFTSKVSINNIDSYLFVRNEN